MLVLSRKEGERLVIGDNITITINRISGNRIAIGVDAPRDVRIVRGELTAFEDGAEVEADQQSTKSPSLGTFDLRLSGCGNVAVLEQADQ